jgi:hypothetical protein
VRTAKARVLEMVEGAFMLALLLLPAKAPAEAGKPTLLWTDDDHKLALIWINNLIERCINNRKVGFPVLRLIYETTREAGGAGEASAAGGAAVGSRELAVGSGADDRRGSERRVAVA